MHPSVPSPRLVFTPSSPLVSPSSPGFYIFINLFLAILLDNFSDTRAGKPKSKSDLQSSKSLSKLASGEGGRSRKSLKALAAVEANGQHAPSSAAGSPARQDSGTTSAGPALEREVSSDASASEEKPTTPPSGSRHGRIVMNELGEIDQFAVFASRPKAAIPPPSPSPAAAAPAMSHTSSTAPVTGPTPGRRGSVGSLAMFATRLHRNESGSGQAVRPPALACFLALLFVLAMKIRPR